MFSKRFAINSSKILQAHFNYFFFNRWNASEEMYIKHTASLLAGLEALDSRVGGFNLDILRRTGSFLCSPDGFFSDTGSGLASTGSV